VRLEQVRQYLQLMHRRIDLARRDSLFIASETALRIRLGQQASEALPSRDSAPECHTLYDLALRVAVSEWADELRIVAEYFPAWRHVAIEAADLVNALDALDEHVENAVLRQLAE
jgi:DNA primase large subunit